MAAEQCSKNGGEYLSFKLGDGLYAIDILSVKEVLGKMEVTAMPKAPGYVEGVVNLRGRMVPVICVSARFGLPRIEDHDRACIIVVEATSPSMAKCWEVKQCGKSQCPAYESDDRRCWMLTGTHCRDEIQGSFVEKREACSKCDFHVDAVENRKVFDIGIVVDEVCDVLNIAESEIEDCPAIATGSDEHCIGGIAKHDGKIINLINIPHTLGGCG